MSGEGASKESKGMYGFDPSGLERAATAAKYLDNSANAKSAFDLAAKKEETLQLEHKKQIKEIEIMKTRTEEEEKRKTLQMELHMAKEKSNYDDQLAKQRLDYKLQRERQNQEELARNQEESIKKQEAMKRATLEYEHSLNLQRDKERILSKFEYKAQLERKNWDLTKEKIKIQETERRTTKREVAKVTMELLGRGVREFLNDKTLMSKVILGVTSIYVIGYGFKSGLNLFFHFLSVRLMTPKLIRETSRIPLNKAYKYPFRFYDRFLKKKTQEDILNGIILKPELEAQLRIVSNTVINRKKHFAPYRNLLFHGPPGTGKTLFAKQLATRSGLDYAILTGADIAPLGTLAVHELHKIFDWAEASSNGILIFIDEADAFLRRRTGDELLSENLRNAINACLYRTGTPSTKFMVVLATNAPQLLDEAVQDRIDEMVNFDRPSIKERVDLLFHYLVKYCQPPKSFKEKVSLWRRHPTSIIYGKKYINISSLQPEYIEEIAQKIEGFSAREVTKLVISWHDAAFAKEDPVLDKDVIEQVLNNHLNQNKTKGKWNNEQQSYFQMMHKKV